MLTCIRPIPPRDGQPDASIRLNPSPDELCDSNRISHQLVNQATPYDRLWAGSTAGPANLPQPAAGSSVGALFGRELSGDVSVGRAGPHGNLAA